MKFRRGQRVFLGGTVNVDGIDSDGDVSWLPDDPDESIYVKAVRLFHTPENRDGLEAERAAAQRIMHRLFDAALRHEEAHGPCELSMMVKMASDMLDTMSGPPPEDKPDDDSEANLNSARGASQGSSQ